MYSANPPSLPWPMPSPFRQRCSRPLRQRSQAPQALVSSDVTLSPGRTPTTPAPASSTTPEISCPKTHPRPHAPAQHPSHHRPVVMAKPAGGHPHQNFPGAGQRLRHIHHRQPRRLASRFHQQGTHKQPLYCLNHRHTGENRYPIVMSHPAGYPPPPTNSALRNSKFPIPNSLHRYPLPRLGRQPNQSQKSPKSNESQFKTNHRPPSRPATPPRLSGESRNPRTPGICMPASCRHSSLHPTTAIYSIIVPGWQRLTTANNG